MPKLVFPDDDDPTNCYVHVTYEEWGLLHNKVLSRLSVDWCKSKGMTDEEMQEILSWNYI